MLEAMPLTPTQGQPVLNGWVAVVILRTQKVDSYSFVFTLVSHCLTSAHRRFTFATNMNQIPLSKHQQWIFTHRIENMISQLNYKNVCVQELQWEECFNCCFF